METQDSPLQNYLSLRGAWAFCSVLVYNWLSEPHPHCGGHSTYSNSTNLRVNHKFKSWSHSRTLASRVYDQVSEHPVAQSTSHVKLTITDYFCVYPDFICSHVLKVFLYGNTLVLVFLFQRRVLFFTKKFKDVCISWFEFQFC